MLTRLALDFVTALNRIQWRPAAVRLADVSAIQDAGSVFSGSYD